MAGFSRVRVANLALSLVRTKGIEDFDEAGTPASQVRQWYDIARQEVLELFNWPFARKRLILAVHDEAAPTNEWAYRYQYPADCLAARAIENAAGTTADAAPFEQERADDGTQSIVTDTDDAVLIYTYDATEAEEFPAAFAVLLAHKLAYYLSGVIAGKATLTEALDGAYRRQAGISAGTVGAQERQRPPRDASWIRER